ncbi:MAG TPA: Uma2 family endonuclease [Tepidisphaeraceae bacterium]|nr:Uma2 family endonuclease [Tepidisphaeraceae bacterium]
MVANTSSAQRFVPPPPPLLDGRWRLVRFTRKDAEALVKQGIVPEDASTELLDGMIVLKDRSARDQDPTMIGPDHRKVVEKLSNLRKQIDTDHRHVESQQPLVCSDIQEPEPDFMVLRDRLEDYTDLPTAADAFCVIEVADSSYERDSGEKLIGYARAGVRQYVIINLRENRAEIYTDPNFEAGAYPPPQIVSGEGSLPIAVGNGETFVVRMTDVLP